MKQVEHIGIAVNSLKNAIPLYEMLLQTACYKTEVVESENVKTAFFKMGESKIELLEGLSPDSAISRFLEKKGEGLHHVAFLVENIHNEMARLQKEGFKLLYTEPKIGADNKLICFIHPKSTHGVLVEICQEIRGNTD